MEIQSDFLVLGSGVAGLTFALKVAAYGTVALVTKKGIMDSNTSQAQGGVASVFGQLDSFDLHIQDTLAAGDGLCNPEVVEMVVKNGPDRILELINLGVNFNLSEASTEDPPALDLGREGGHSRKRIVHAQDMTGLEIERVLVEHVRRNNRITVCQSHIAIDLITRSARIKRGTVITTHEESCHGAYVQDRNTREVKAFCAKIRCWQPVAPEGIFTQSNPDICHRGRNRHGYQAGAMVANLEFVQFHPTCLYHGSQEFF